jgi:signal transduction histidine kinase
VGRLALIGSWDRIVGWARRLRTILRQHPVAADTASALMLFVLTAPRDRLEHPPQSLQWVLSIALVLPLVFRRRAPMVVFAVLAAIALVQWQLHRLVGADLAVLIAFYTVAAHAPRRNVLIAAAVLELGAIMAAIRFAPGDKKLEGWVLISGMIVVAGVIGTNLRTRRAYLAALEDRADRLERDRDQQAQLAVSAERARIAREMHDIVAHNISVMIALADGAGFTNRRDPDRAEEIMGKVSETGRQALDEMRRLLGVLREGTPEPELAPLPGFLDLDDLVGKVRTAGLPARLTTSGQRFPMPPTAQLTVYRLVQEALTNTLKHAEASTAHVRLSYRDGHILEVEITDNGMAPGEHLVRDGSGGHGIAGMRERAAMFGGLVEAGPLPAGGWRVHTQLRVNGADRRE